MHRFNRKSVFHKTGSRHRRHKCWRYIVKPIEQLYMDVAGVQAFNRIMYVTLFASDQDRALEFYTKSLGFHKCVDYSGPDGRFLTMALEDQGFEVLLWLGTSGSATNTSGVGALFIESDDLRADFAKLKAQGVQFLESEPQVYPFGLRVTALDPDGNPVALRQTRK